MIAGHLADSERTFFFATCKLTVFALFSRGFSSQDRSRMHPGKGQDRPNSTQDGFRIETGIRLLAIALFLGLAIGGAKSPARPDNRRQIFICPRAIARDRHNLAENGMCLSGAPVVTYIETA